MSTQVDNRVVEMTFDNARFEKNVKQSMESIKQLDKDLKIIENASYLTNLDKSIKNFSLDTIANSVESLSDRFSTMGIIGMNVISRLTNSALDFAKKIKTSFIDPIKSGGMTRALNIEQAEFQLKGLGMDVASVMEDVNYAVQDTAYGLDAAAKIAAQFGASGIKSGDQMKSALRGVSGVAAMTSSSYEDIGRIFATVAGNGRLMANELNQIGARGLNAAAALGKYLGVSEAEVRDMTSKGKIDFQTFAMAMDSAFGEHAKEANKTFTGALSNMKAAMNRIGAEFAAPYIENMRDVINAVTPWLNNLKTSLKPVATDAENIMIGMNKRIVKALGDEDWVGAQTNAVDIFRNSLKALLTIFSPIAKAWKEVFPNTAAKTIKDFTKNVSDFTAKLGLNTRSMKNLRDTFKGLFSILKVVGDIFGNLLKIIFPFTSGANGLLSVILEITGVFGRLVTSAASVYDSFGGISTLFNGIKNAALALFSVIFNGTTSLYHFATRSKLVQFFIKGMELAIMSVIVSFVLLIEQIKKLWDSDPTKFFKNLKNDFAAFAKEVGNLRVVQSILSIFSRFLEKIGINVDKSKESFRGFISAIKGMASEAKQAFKTDGIVAFFKSIFDSIEKVIEKVKELRSDGGIFSGITDSESLLEKTSNKLKAFIEVVKDFVSGLTPGKIAAFAFSAAIVSMAFSLNKGVDTITGLAGSIKGFFGSLTSAIKGVTTKKPKSAIVQFAEAVAILSASLVALTLVDSDKLVTAAKAIGLLVAEMAGIGIIFSILSKFKLTGDFQSASKAMIMLSGSVLILTGALMAMSRVEMEGIGTKLLVMMGVMASLATMATLMAKFAPKLTKGSLFMLAFSLATANVIKALGSLESINLEEMGSRIVALFTIMAGMAILAKGVGSVRLTSVVGLYLLIKVLEHTLPTIKNIFDVLNIKNVQKKIEDSIVMIGMISALALAIGFAFDKFGRGFGKLGVGLIALSGAILLLTQVPKILKKANLDTKSFDKAMKFITVTIGLFTAITVLSGLSNAGKASTKIGLMAIEIATAIMLLAGATALFGGMDDKSFKKGLFAVDSMLLLFGGIIACMKFAQKVDTKVLIGVVIGAILLMGELIVLTLMDWDELIPAAASMAIALLSFSKSLSIISKTKVNTGHIMGMVAMASIVGELAIIFDKLAKHNWKSLLASGVAMSATMMVYAEVLKTISSRTGLKVNKIAQVIATAASMIPMAVSLSILAKYDWDKMFIATSSMGMTLLAVAAVFSILGKIGGKDTALASVGIITTAGAMIILAAAFQEFMKVDWKSLKDSTGPILAVVGTLAILAGVSAIFPEFGAALITVAGAFAVLGVALMAAGAGMQLSATGLKLMVPILEALSGIDLKEIGSGLLQIAPALTLIGVSGPYLMIAATAFLMFGTSLLAIGGGILIASAGLKILVPVLEALSKIDIKTVASGLLKLAPALYLFGMAALPMSLLANSFAILAASLLPAGAGIALAAIGLREMTPALEALSSLDIKTIATGLLQLAPGILLLGLAGTGMLIGSVGLATGALALIALKQALIQYENMDLSPISEQLLTIAKGLTALAGVGILLIPGSIGISMSGLGLISLSAGLSMLAKLDIERITEAIRKLAPALVLFGAAGSSMLIASTAFAILGAGLMMAGSGILTAGSGLTILIPALQELVKLDLIKVSTGMMQLAPGILLLGIAGTMMLAGSVGILAGALGLMALSPAVMRLEEIDLESIGQQLLTLAGGAMAMGAAGLVLALGTPGILVSSIGLTQFSNAVLMLNDVNLTLIGEGIMSIAQSGLALGAAGMVMLSGAPGLLAVSFAITTLSSGIEQAGQMIENASIRIQNALNNLFDNLAVNAAQAGIDAVSGLVTSVSSNLEPILNVGQNMAISLLNGIRIAGGWHSPWTQTAQAGVDAGAGIIEGSQKTAGPIQSTWEEICNKGILGVIQKAVAKVKSILSNLGIDISSFAESAGIDLDNLSISLDGLSDSASNLGFEFEDLSDWTKNFAGETEALLDTETLLNSETGDLAENFDGLGESMSSAGGSAKSAQSAMSKLTDTIANQLDIFSKFEMKTDMTGEQMLENMRSQIAGVSQWANNISLLAERGINKGLLEKLTDLGPQGYEKVAAFVQMTDEQLSEAGNLFAQSLTLPKSAASQILGSFGDSGKNAVQGFVNGMSGNSGKAEDASLGVAKAALKAFNSGFDIHSPSGETEKSGKNVDLGFVKGVWENRKLILDKIEALCKIIVKEFEKGLDQSQFTRLGIDIVEGMAKGIEQNTSKTITAVTEVSTQSLLAAQNVLEIKSPSRKFEWIGRMSDEGLANGFLKNGYIVTNAVEDVGDDMLNRFNGIVTAVSGIFDRGIGETPVIKPTLDLSNVIAGVQEINGMFESQRLKVGSIVSNEGATGKTGGDTIFQQYNYSPKALSSIDIYRNTKNLMSMAKG